MNWRFVLRRNWPLFGLYAFVLARVGIAMAGCQSPTLDERIDALERRVRQLEQFLPVGDPIEDCR